MRGERALDCGKLLETGRYVKAEGTKKARRFRYRRAFRN